MGRDISNLIKNNKMDNLEYFQKLKEKLIEDGWVEQSCGEIYLLSSIGTNFYKDREIIHLSIEICPNEESLSTLKV